MVYKVVTWPDSQELMEHPRFNECLLINDGVGLDTYGPSAYMVPIGLYLELKENWPSRQIVLDKRPYAWGRNGRFVQKGILVQENHGVTLGSDILEIRAVSMRNHEGNVAIRIAKDELYKLIYALL